jgi:outer membrane murein-binding lipoprotein Lpp
VGYFEHSGVVASAAAPAEILLRFDAAAVNDALKSLVVNDPAAAGSDSSPSVRYAVANSLDRALRSLKIDLSGSPGIVEILNNQKGAELEVYAPNAIRGRIIGVEYRMGGFVQQYGYAQAAPEPWLSLFTAQGIRVIAVKDIASFVFIDERISADLNRALDLILASREDDTRNLLVTLAGAGSREVSLSYVIPTPVWKVSYRLDLSGREPFLQGWAIVDNDSDTDWENIELSLVTGRPVSFIQNLYPPYRVSRPVVPLAIAGIAESRTYESGYGAAYDQYAEMEKAVEMARAESDSLMLMQRAPMAVPAPAQATAAVGVGGTAATGSAAGDQFEFTLKNPVTLERRQSAMLPLVEAVIEAEKVLVFSGSRAMNGGTINPGISAELTNNTGMKLPAGPITVYDGGTYSGDALIEFFPENEKRLISYGDDLSVTGSVTSSSSRYVSTVRVVSGIMTIARRQVYERVYTIRNASDEQKKLILEHPILSGYELIEPISAEDRTASLYRFTRYLTPRETHTFTVREEYPVSETITLANLRPDTFLSYSTNQEIPAEVRAALTRAIELRVKTDEAATAQRDLETQLARLIAEQDRIRRNLEAAGNTSPQGQDYLRRLASLDSDIDDLNSQISDAVREVQRARREYEDYLASIRI